MDEIVVKEYHGAVSEDLAHLVAESSAEGFRHIKRLVDDYENGTNRFDQHGEALFVATHNHRIVGVCGLNREPLANPRVGRVRRLYVSPGSRRQGIARLLVHQVVQEARRHYELLVLKTDNPAAAKFYDSLGFLTRENDERVTHILELT